MTKNPGIRIPHNARRHFNKHDPRAKRRDLPDHALKRFRKLCPRRPVEIIVSANEDNDDARRFTQHVCLNSAQKLYCLVVGSPGIHHATRQSPSQFRDVCLIVRPNINAGRQTVTRTDNDRGRRNPFAWKRTRQIRPAQQHDRRDPERHRDPSTGKLAHPPRATQPPHNRHEHKPRTPPERIEPFSNEKQHDRADDKRTVPTERLAPRKPPR